MAEAQIEVRNLDAHYGATQVLEDVSLEIAKGAVYIIVGASGCGKTTLLKHMAGLLHPTSGTIHVNGADITTMDDDELAQVQRGFGIAFQSGGLFNSMTVGDNVAVPMREFGMVDEEIIPTLVRLKLSLVGLAKASHLLPSELSGGMKKRAGLARAIALDPPLVFFDEPSAGLDPIMAATLDDLILELRDLLGITFVIVTHELDSIRRIADELIMLDLGKVIFRGTVEEAENSDNDRVRQFFERRPDEFISQRNI